jgi:hypothetical protein
MFINKNFRNILSRSLLNYTNYSKEIAKKIFARRDWMDRLWWKTF